MSEATMAKRIDDAKTQARIKKAERLGRKAKRRMYLVDHEDATQQALLTMYEAERRHEPETGTPLEAYVFGAAVSQLVTFVWQSTSPVHITFHALRTENRGRVAGLRSVEIAWERQEKAAPLPQQLQVGWQHGAAEDALDTQRIRDRVAEMLSQIDEHPVAYAAVRVLIRESGPKAEATALVAAGVAADVRTATRRINQATSRIRETLMSRPDLLALVKGTA